MMSYFVIQSPALSYTSIHRIVSYSSYFILHSKHSPLSASLRLLLEHLCFCDFKMAISRLSIIKFLELALTCACVALHYHSYNSDPETGMLVTGTFVGFLIIFAGAAAGYILQTPSHKRVDIFYSLVGVALFVASGAVLIDRYQHYSKSDIRDKNLAKASLSIINGAILLIDAVLTQRGG